MDKLATILEYAAIIGRHRHTVARWIAKGAKLPMPAIGVWTSPAGRRWIRIDRRYAAATARRQQAAEATP